MSEKPLGVGTGTFSYAEMFRTVVSNIFTMFSPVSFVISDYKKYFTSMCVYLLDR